MARLRAAALIGALGPVAQDLWGGSEQALVEELRRQCAELERSLKRDPLSFQNQALEVQLAQMQDDYSSLLDDFRGAQEYFGKQVAELGAQLQDSALAAEAAAAAAGRLEHLAAFHEDQSRLARSYWRAQCEKRDESVRFLGLKLQEYTVPNAEYQARRMLPPEEGAADTPATRTPQSTPQQSSSPASSAPLVSPPLPPDRKGEAVLPPLFLSPPAQDYQALLDGHAELCRELQEREEEGRALERELQACELSCAALRASASAPAAPASAFPPPPDYGSEDDLRLLQAEVEECEAALAEESQAAASVTPWPSRCEWRCELERKAGQLERVSKQSDAAQRALDAANDELQWQATCAEALRQRLSDVLRVVRSEQAAAKEFREEQQRSEGAIQEMLEQGAPPSGGSGAFTLACQQARWLLERFRQGEAREEAVEAAAIAGGSVMPGSPPPSARNDLASLNPEVRMVQPVLTWTTGFLSSM